MQPAQLLEGGDVGVPETCRRVLCLQSVIERERRRGGEEKEESV
jgi:hypothetical protein